MNKKLVIGITFLSIFLLCSISYQPIVADEPSFSDDIDPTIEFIKPQLGIYVNNMKFRAYVFCKTLILGRINIEFEASDDESGINYTELYIDNKKKATFTEEPYSLLWEKGPLFKFIHVIKIVAYDNVGNFASKENKVWKFP